MLMTYSFYLILVCLYRLKDGSVGSSDLYLGTSITRCNNGERSMSNDRYISAAIKNVEAYLEEVGESLRGKIRAVTPFASGYKPELDSNNLLGSVEATKYQELIGVPKRQNTEIHSRQACLDQNAWR